MIDAYITQLNDPDPGKRREAIVALGRAKDLAAIPHLARVFREDTHLELQELARKAAQYIRQSNAGTDASAPLPGGRPIGEPPIQSVVGAGGMAGAGAAVGRDGDEEPAQPPLPPEPKGPVRGRTYTVAPEKVKTARSFTEAALDAQMRGESDRAMKTLALALSLNPNLVNDGYYMNIAASITGLEGDGAVQMIVDSDQRKSYIKEKQREKKKAKIDSHLSKAKESSWGSTLFEAFLFIVINSVGPILLLLIVSELAGNLFGTIDLGELSAQERATMRDLQARLPFAGGGLPIVVFLIIGAIGAVGGILGYSIQGGIIHLMARLLGGRGTFTHMATLVLRFFNRYSIVVYILLGILFIVLFVTLGSPIVFCVVIPLVLYGFYFFFKLAATVGEAYDFGSGMGCVTVIVSSIVLALVSSLISFTLGQLIINAVTPLLENPPI